MLAEPASAIPFIFFSTDLVFDGANGNYDENACVGPLGVYAGTKVAAEKIVLANPRHTVIRLALSGGTSPSGDRGFNEQLRRAWSQGRVTRLYADEFRCALPAVAAACAVWDLLKQNQPGLYHLAGRERLSRLEIGQLVAARWPHLGPRLEAASLKEHRGSPRPPDVSLNCARLQSLLTFPLPGLSEWLAGNPDTEF